MTQWINADLLFGSIEIAPGGWVTRPDGTFGQQFRVIRRDRQGIVESEELHDPSVWMCWEYPPSLWQRFVAWWRA